MKPIADEHYPSKANKEIIFLHDLITPGILAYLYFNEVIKHAYNHFIEPLFSIVNNFGSRFIRAVI